MHTRDALRSRGNKGQQSTNNSQAMSEGKERIGKLQQLVNDTLIGCAIGAVAKTAMSPMERMKLLLPDVMSGRKREPCSSVGDCFGRVYAEQGLATFWRGNLRNCLRYAPQQGSALAFNDFINENLFPKYDSKTDFWKSFGAKLTAGGLAGSVANTICYPFDFARMRLASDVKKGKGQFNGIMDCIMTTLRSQGITGVYTGWSVAVAGAFVYRAGQLGCFKQIQDMNPYKKDKGTLGAVSAFVAVRVARTVVMPCNYPFETVRRRMLLQGRLYKGSVHCFMSILKKEGLKGMYKGMVPELLRGHDGSLIIVVYDRIKTIFGI